MPRTHRERMAAMVRPNTVNRRVETCNHLWLEITAHGDIQHEFICRDCSARKAEPFAADGHRGAA